MKKTVFITGATSGIGLASAEIFAANGYNLVICGRRRDRLDELKSQLGGSTRIASLIFDVRDKAAVKEQVDSLSPDFRNIDILINNAGNAHGLDTIDEGKPGVFCAMAVDSCALSASSVHQALL